MIDDRWKRTIYSRGLNKKLCLHEVFQIPQKNKVIGYSREHHYQDIDNRLRYENNINNNKSSSQRL